MKHDFTAELLTIYEMKIPSIGEMKNTQINT